MGSDVALTWSCLGGYANSGPQERVERLDWLRAAWKRLVWRAAGLEALLRCELGCQSFGSQTVDGGTGRSGCRDFFSPCIKTIPSQSDWELILSELLSRMSFTGKTTCVLDS